MKANDLQVGGSHYQTSKVQHWDLISEMGTLYLIGCATKYVSRWRKKNGREDLEKALHYVSKLEEVLMAGQVGLPDEKPNLHDFVCWVFEADLTRDEAEICSLLLYANGRLDIELAARKLVELLNDAG